MLAKKVGMFERGTGLTRLNKQTNIDQSFSYLQFKQHVIIMDFIIDDNCSRIRTGRSSSIHSGECVPVRTISHWHMAHALEWQNLVILYLKRLIKELKLIYIIFIKRKELGRDFFRYNSNSNSNDSKIWKFIQIGLLDKIT